MLLDIPSRLDRLSDIAYNLFWTWSPSAQRLFARLDPQLWEETEHNPVRLIQETSNLSAAAEDREFIEEYDRVTRDFQAYMERSDTWAAGESPKLEAPVAYFSAEFGLHESLPVYSGGLGILAGDHVKSASDLGLPLVGVGLLYAQGYFRQRIDGAGRQQEVYEPFDPERRPLRPAVDEDGAEVKISIDLKGRELCLKVWRVEVGRSYILLLDADVPENPEEDRRLTAHLYGGGNETRIVQELILGVAGVRALRATGIRPAVYHMNEGHAAFSVLERMRERVAAGNSFEEAREGIIDNTVFTTHTPVPAGHDAFPPDLFWEFLSGWPAKLATSEDEFWRLGHKQEEWGPMFNMTALATSHAASTNAVSDLHREVSEEMWGMFEENGHDHAPISHVTNGIHTWTWLSHELSGLFDLHSADSWREDVQDTASWDFVREIPAEQLWSAHARAKLGMAEFVNHRLRLQAERTGNSFRELDPDALTLGFARRFATYKRATLLLTDPERLHAIATAAERPVQFIFAGKAHPADEPAKEFLETLYKTVDDLDGRLIVLEDYDMNVARHLVQGVDVWLNNPRRPLEASGTSGQKASLNGAPNFSVLDGWWPEAYNGKNGWTIGEEREYASLQEQDAADAESLYAALEQELVPLYYDRNSGAVPEGWVEVMQEAIATIAPRFSTQRMVQDYTEKLYVPRTKVTR
jgi:starch phosphorylase